MKRSIFSRFLSLMLALVMVLSMLPMPAHAAETATWTKVDAADITAEDTIAVTMTNPNGVTYALYTVQSGSKGPTALVVTVDGDTMTTDGTADYGWTVTPVDGGYTLSVDGSYLYTTDANNGVRIGDTAAVWAVDGSYLSTTDPSGNTRWLGVYDNNNGDYSAVATPNWRAYKNTTGNTKNQTLAFWKLTGTTEGEGEPVETTDYVLTDSLSDGDVVIIYNAGNSAALTSTASGYKLAGESLTPVDNVISTDLTSVLWTVSVNDDGTYTFSQGDLVLGMVQSGSYVNLSTNAADGYTAWSLSEGTGDSVFYMQNTNMPAGSYGPYYLEYYSGFTAYASSSPSDSAFGVSFYKLNDESGEEDPVEPVETTDYVLTDSLSDGDVVIIYNAGNSAALTSTASGYKLAGEALAPVDNVISTDLTSVLWTVSVNDDGTYTFSQGDLVLGMVKSGSYVNLSTNAADGYTAWSLSEGTGDSVFYMQNTNMPAGSYGPYYLEYYTGFTAYASSSPSDAAYGVSFYKLPTTPTYTLTNSLSDGDVAIIYNAGNSAALTSTASGYKLAGEALAPVDNVISTDLTSVLWTVSVNDDGTYTFSQGDLVLGMVQSGSYVNLSTNAADGYTAWSLSEGTGDSVFYMQNTNMPAGSYGPYYLEYYSGFTAYASNSPSDPAYGMQFYVQGGGSGETGDPSDGLPTAGEQIVIYNLAAKGVLAAENDTQSIENALTEIVDGAAIPGNGGVIFTVEHSGDYYRFHNETYGYLCSNGTGNNAFYSLEASEDADWTLHQGKSGGWFMESRTAKYNGTYSQYLEYYSDSYKTYSMYNVTDYDIYEFVFYPVAEGVQTWGGIVNQPTVDFGTLGNAYVGVDYTFSVTVDAIFGVETMTVKYNDQVLTASADGSYYVIGGDTISGESFTITVEGVDTKGVSFSGTATVTVVDEPSVTDVTPAAGSETGADKKPIISATITNEGENATVTMTVNGETVDAVYTPEHTDIDGLTATYYPSTVTWTSAEDMADGRYTVTVTVTRADGKTASRSWSFTVGEKQFELYFGQLHSHTTYSDGSGSLETALDYIASLPESANVDFVAFTDHSNYFDTSSDANPEQALYDMSLASSYSQGLWSAYKESVADFNATHTDVIAIAGFEMTWSGGPGHINTFATEGIVSRNNATLNNKTSDAGMKAYYALLSQAEGIDSISQFNHPGTTFGNFTDFAYWDAVVDSRIYLVEVGNGEGAIGAGGYYPSYEQYTMALDKGWHVAPTNNQDNHKGKWGNANEARDVVLTDDFSEEGIYEAIRNYRVYATEDKNLEIGYTVNGQQLGSTIEEVPEVLNLEVTLYDPDSSDSISKVEVIVNSGKVAYTWDDPAQLATGVLTAEIAPDYSYYYIRVTQGDGDLAVTAPVWVGETLKLGISAVETSTSTPVTDEALTISTTLFNSELGEATVTSLVYTVGDQVIGVDNTGYTIPASGNTTVDFVYTPDVAKVMTVTVTAYVTLDGVDYVFTMDIELDVQDASKLVYIGIDASHYNEYVNGNYKDSMGNFSELAAQYNVRTVTLYTSEELIAACSNEKYVALIMTAPSRRSSEAQSADPLKVYTAEELAAITAFNKAGGTVILAGWSDHYENYPTVDAIANMQDYEHMAATQNAVLEALGSSLRIGDDATYDDEYNGGQAYRLYFNTYNYDSFLVEGVEVDEEHPHDRLYTEVFSHYGGASVYTADGTLSDTVTPVVFGHSGTYSVDVDKDGLGGESMPKYEVAEGDSRLMIMASEQLEGQGLIIVSGAAFMSNFEVQATIEDSGSEKNYSNYKVCENLLAYLNPVEVTPIAEVQAQTEVGIKYTIEGVVTSNASGYDKDTAFFDCIYVQDETAGVCCFPVAGNYKVGDLVRITGTTDFYQGEMELQVTSIEVIGEGTVEPTAITAAQLSDGSVLGSLVTLNGTVESFEYANSLVQTIMVRDENGDLGRVFIDGYITTSYDVENLAVGNAITVTGLASYDNTFDGPAPRIRVRDRKDVVCTDTFEMPFVDVEEDSWYYDAVEWAVRSGVTTGVTETIFAPTDSAARCQVVTMLWRMAGCPEPTTTENPFTDVSEGQYFYKAVLWAVEEGITNGTTATTFSPFEATSRCQVVTFLWRMAGKPEPTTTENPFADVAETAYYYDAVLWAYENGITTGVSQVAFAPNNTCDRATIVTLLYRWSANG